MKLFTNAKRTLSLVLAVAMALTMMSVMSVSAEDATTETETETETVSVYDRFAWSPMKGVTITKGAEVTTTTTTENVDLAEAQALVAITGNATKSIESQVNEDGTISANKVTTVHTCAANEDGTTATVTTTVTKIPYTIVNPAVQNTYFKLGMRSGRDNDSRGQVVYATELNPFTVYNANDYANNFGSAGNVCSNNQHKIVATSGDVNLIKSFYLIGGATTAMDDVLTYRLQQYNEMYLEFTAPEDGVYTTSGSASKVRTSGGTVDDVIGLYVAKVDSDGVEHTVSESLTVPTYSASGFSAIPEVKVSLKAGEKLVLRTTASTGWIGKIFLKDYLVTKYDYAEAEDNSTVTVNYGYQNNNALNVYGETYAISDTYFKTLWNVKAARYTPDTDELDTTKGVADFNKLFNTGSVIRTFTSASSFAVTTSQGTKNPAVVYNIADGSLQAQMYNGAVSDVSYKFGLQFTFTVPEDGNVVLTGARQSGSNTIARVGIKKKDSDQVVYGIYYNTEGGTTYGSERGIWNYIRVTDSTLSRTHDLGQLEAGDVIYYEMSTNDVTSSGTKMSDLSTLNVAITTENSVVDLNGDFKGDASDVVYLRKYLLRSINVNDVVALDLTGDEKADLRDLVKIKKIVAGVE